MRSHPRRCLKAAAAWVPHRGSRGRGLTPSRRQRTARAAEPQGKGDAQEVSGQDRASKEPSSSNKLGKGVNLFDPAATASRFLTRRFGFAGGLGFVALLASTELYEIVKALLESDSEGSGEVVETPSGLSYRDIKVTAGRNAGRGSSCLGGILTRRPTRPTGRRRPATEEGRLRGRELRGEGERRGAHGHQEERPPGRVHFWKASLPVCQLRGGGGRHVHDEARGGSGARGAAPACLRRQGEGASIGGSGPPWRVSDLHHHSGGGHGFLPLKARSISAVASSYLRAACSLAYPSVSKPPGSSISKFGLDPCLIAW